MQKSQGFSSEDLSGVSGCSDYFILSCLKLHFFVVDPKHSIYGVFTSLLHKIENIRAGIKKHLHFHFE